MCDLVPCPWVIFLSSWLTNASFTSHVPSQWHLHISENQRTILWLSLFLRFHVNETLNYELSSQNWLQRLSENWHVFSSMLLLKVLPVNFNSMSSCAVSRHQVNMPKHCTTYTVECFSRSWGNYLPLII